ncbi:hypothetical protein D8S78_21800 [Natrialba swarupiae]|nr:hypothetical protein [Natrialba swarupiae]
MTHSDSVDIIGGEFTDIGGSAISVWHSSSVSVDEVDVMDAEYGLDVFDSDGVTVSNVDFTAVGRTAIHVEHVEGSRSSGTASRTPTAVSTYSRQTR